MRRTFAGRNCGHWRRQCTQDFLPLRSVTGAIPAYCWSAAAAAERARCSPKATSSRGAKTPAPGRAWKREKSGWLCALRAGVDIGDSLQGDPELSDEGLHQERMGRDDTVIGGEGV